MTKIFKIVTCVALFASYLSAAAQSISSSPYSSFGIGYFRGSSLPQNRAMAGVSAGIRRFGAYSDLNIANPASYSSISLTTFDIGMYGLVTNLSRGGNSQTGFDASLNHIAFGVPVSAKSALSFGLVPYSDLGYRYSNPQAVNDTSRVSYIYRGEGGVSKAYLGYGFQIGKNLSLGLNAGYLFGKLAKVRGAEFPGDPAALSSREESNNSLGGFTFDYGLQYFTNISKRTRLTLGYSGTSNSKINSTNSSLVTTYRVDQNGNESIALDTLSISQRVKNKVTLPLMHTFGLSLARPGNWMLATDVSFANWSDFRAGNTNPGFNNTYGIAVGGQYIPDINAVSNYLSIIEYRLGFKYDKTYININNTDIKQNAITIGFGFPLPSNRSSLQKINLGAEIGQRGTLENGLVRERFTSFYLNFTLNDKWFQKYKFD